MDIGIQMEGSMGKLATTDRVFCPTLMCPRFGFQLSVKLSTRILCHRYARRYRRRALTSPRAHSSCAARRPRRLGPLPTPSPSLREPRALSSFWTGAQGFSATRAVQSSSFLGSKEPPMSTVHGKHGAPYLWIGSRQIKYCVASPKSSWGSNGGSPETMIDMQESVQSQRKTTPLPRQTLR